MTDANKATVIFVPGFWEGNAGVFSRVATTLQRAHGVSTVTLSLTSTGHASPGNPSLQDDINVIRHGIASVVEQGREVVVLAHSAGGFIAGAAIKDLSQKERAAESLKGGVTKIAFVAAGVMRQGDMSGPMPFFDIRDDGSLHAISPRTTLFNDLNDADAQFWDERMEQQPAAGWDAAVPHADYSHVSCHYLVCEGDALVPPAMQRQMATVANATVHECSGGHMVMLSQPEALVKYITDVIKA